MASRCGLSESAHAASSRASSSGPSHFILPSGSRSSFTLGTLMLAADSGSPFGPRGSKPFLAAERSLPMRGACPTDLDAGVSRADAEHARRGPQNRVLEARIRLRPVALAIQELSLGFEPVFNVSTGPLSTRQIDLEGAPGNLVVTRPPRCLGPGFGGSCRARGLALIRTRHQSPPLLESKPDFPVHPGYPPGR
jgi:hypothetical protein